MANKKCAETILIVDDVNENIEVLGRMLKGAGYRVQIADSGKTAFKLLEVQVPHMILLDIVMPEMDGFAVCQKLKEKEETRDIPIIFISALRDVKEKVQGLSRGGVDYIEKPFQEEEVLARVATHLELHRLQREIRARNENLIRLDREKTDILRIVSHDLRNPIGYVREFAELLSNRKESSLSEERIDEFLAAIRTDCDGMLRLIDDLLDASRIESGSLLLRSGAVDLLQVLAEVKKSYRTRARKKSIQIQSDIPEHPAIVQADRRALHEVLENLVSNAVKYSSPGQHVGVTVHDKGYSIECEISDEGLGLSEEDMKKLFRPFAPLSSQPTDGEASTGLGLYIVKKLLDAMGGGISVRSPGKGRGTTFVLDLPKADLPTL